MNETLSQNVRPLKHPSEFFIGGQWVQPHTNEGIAVIDPSSEREFFTVAKASVADMDSAIGAARAAFDRGPWPTMSHAERASFLRRLADEIERRLPEFNAIWPREAGVVLSTARAVNGGMPDAFRYYADLAETFPFVAQQDPSDGQGAAYVVREPVGVVGAIIPWNSPLSLITYKIAPALLAGCTAVLKSSPEAPGEAYLIAEIAEEIGLPAGVLNVVTADREVSELLVSDPRVDKISFTGSTVVGRRIANILSYRIGRFTLELGGKSAAIILDDYDLDIAARALAEAECLVNGQVCSSLTRIIVPRHRHDDFAAALGKAFSSLTVGDPMDESSHLGPLVAERQRARVEEYIARGVDEGADLVTGGGRPAHLDRGWYVEPTVFANVKNSATIAQEEIFGPVLTVIPAEDETDAIRIANDTIYGLNASVFTNDSRRAFEVARQIRSGTVGHNAFKSDFGVMFGGFKQSGIGREGGRDGLLPYLEGKAIFLDEALPG